MGRGYKKASAVGGAAAAPTPRGWDPHSRRWGSRGGRRAAELREPRDALEASPPRDPPCTCPGRGGRRGRRQLGVISALSPTAAPERRYLSAPTAPRPGIARREGPKERNGTKGGEADLPPPTPRAAQRGLCAWGRAPAPNKAALSWDRGGNAGIWGERGRVGEALRPSVGAGKGGGGTPRPPKNTPRFRCSRRPRVLPTSRPPAPRPQHMAAAAAPPAALPHVRRTAPGPTPALCPRCFPFGVEKQHPGSARPSGNRVPSTRSPVRRRGVPVGLRSPPPARFPARPEISAELRGLQVPHGGGGGRRVSAEEGVRGTRRVSPGADPPQPPARG